jgi:hypothetical protein
MSWVPELIQASRDGRSVVVAAAVMLLIAALWKLTRRGPRETHKRGVLIGGDARRVPGFLHRADPNLLTVAGVAIPALDETKHFKFIGTTGTGKSTAIREWWNRAIGRGDRAVFADPDGAYRREF